MPPLISRIQPIVHSFQPTGKQARRLTRKFTIARIMEKQGISSRMILIAHLLFWMSLAAILYFYVKGLMPQEQILGSVLINVVFLVLTFYITRMLVNRYLEKGKHLFFVALSALGLGLLFVLRLYLEAFTVGKELKGISEMLFRQENAPFPGGGIVAVYTVAVMFQLIINRFRNERELQKKLQTETETKLVYLKSQINPHMLFNMLNNIYSLEVAGSPKAQEMVLGLSEMLRYSLYTTEDGTTMLEDEIAQIRKYIQLMQLKNDRPLNVSLQVKGQVHGKKILPMLLLPLIENCFKHSDVEVSERGFVEVDIHIDHHIRFHTRNSIRTLTSAGSHQSTKTGLENLRKRLEIAYPGASLKTTENNGVFELELLFNPLEP